MEIPPTFSGTGVPRGRRPSDILWIFWMARDLTNDMRRQSHLSIIALRENWVDPVEKQVRCHSPWKRLHISPATCGGQGLSALPRSAAAVG
jgi:hypothetical protein